jgi:hypothetical protein
MTCGCFKLALHPYPRTIREIQSAAAQGATAVAVTSGANMNFDRLRLVTELADIGALSEAMLATSIPERPGSFKEFMDIALVDSSLQITEFKYRWVCFRSRALPLQLLECCQEEIVAGAAGLLQGLHG